MKVLPPVMPNFIHLDTGDKKNPLGYPVTELTRKQAEEYAEFMKQTFIKHWEVKVGEKSLTGK